MKIKTNFELVEIADEYLLIPVGEEQHTFQGIAMMNDGAAFLAGALKEERTARELVEMLTEEFDVDEEQAEKDVRELLKQFGEMGLLEGEPLIA